MSEPGHIEDWRSMLDQARASLKDMAAVLGSYQADLSAEGFSREEALQIVIAWQATQLSAREDS